jgi:hypothetical protein
MLLLHLFIWNISNRYISRESVSRKMERIINVDLFAA